MTDRSRTGTVAHATFGYRRDKRAFTLVELLIVIALSGLILALLFAPIIQGFHLTAKAKSLVQAQDASRNGLEQFSREVSQASYVFDNSTTPITLPLEATDNTQAAMLAGTAVAPVRKQNGNPVYPTSGSAYIVQPQEAFGRVDLISSDVVNPGTGAAIDPTTNTPIGGADLRVPLAPSGTRYVRYFIGLQSNTDTTGTKPLYYQNLYEFHGSAADQDFNPFILYRAEYDPNDPNLIPQTTSGPVLKTVYTGNNATVSGFDDVNFFYNLGAASTTNRSNLTGNGKTYAANWKAIASPVVTGHNLDMLIWRRNSNGGIDPNTPFTLGASFAPSSVVNDVATPGFLTNAQAEAPSALPTLYTSQFGGWTLPFTVNVLRASTQGKSGANGGANYGNVSLSFAYGPSVGGVQGNLSCTVTAASGVFSDDLNVVFYATYSPTTGKYFVSLPELTFLIDPSRGRIETGLPAIAVSKGVPFFTFNGSVPAGMQPSAIAGGFNTETILPGDLVPTIYRQSTLDHQDANASVPNAANITSFIPANQGITFADLQGNFTGGGTDSVSLYGGYFGLPSLQMTIVNAFNTATIYESPFRPNTLTRGFDGAMLVLGSERVVGPDNNLTTTTVVTGRTRTTVPLLIDYNRVPAGPADLAKNNVGSAVQGALYARNSPLNYQFDPRLQLTNEPVIEFDNHPANYDTTVGTYQPFLIANLPAGLPTPSVIDPTNPPVTEIQVSFLWQNNYARETVNTDELPVDANGNNQAQVTSGTFQPEPDVFQVTYATRSLINVALGARVYDIYSGQPVFAQVTNKIKVNNVGR